MTRVASSPTDSATNKAIIRLETELENLHIKIRSLEAEIVSMKSDISTKASQSALDALDVRVTALEDA